MIDEEVSNNKFHQSCFNHPRLNIIHPTHSFQSSVRHATFAAAMLSRSLLLLAPALPVLVAGAGGCENSISFSGFKDPVSVSTVAATGLPGTTTTTNSSNVDGGRFSLDVLNGDWPNGRGWDLGSLGYYPSPSLLSAVGGGHFVGFGHSGCDALGNCRNCAADCSPEDAAKSRNKWSLIIDPRAAGGDAEHPGQLFGTGTG